METKEAIKESRNRKLVPADKFDRHMTRARIQDIESRRTIFCQQTEVGMNRTTTRKELKTSIY